MRARELKVGDVFTHGGPEDFIVLDPVIGRLNLPNSPVQATNGDQYCKSLQNGRYAWTDGSAEVYWIRHDSPLPPSPLAVVRQHLVDAQTLLRDYDGEAAARRGYSQAQTEMKLVLAVQEMVRWVRSPRWQALRADSDTALRFSLLEY